MKCLLAFSLMQKASKVPEVVKTVSVAVKEHRVKHMTNESGWLYVLAWTPCGREWIPQFAAASCRDRRVIFTGRVLQLQVWEASPFLRRRCTADRSAGRNL